MHVVGAGVAEVWRAVRPDGRYQRLLWWCGTALVASGAAHGVVAVIDFGPWWGPVSWRKPVLFGLSFGLLVWSVVWLLRRLPARWWTRVPAGLVVFSSVAEVALITAQRWRGTASHFNQVTPADSAVWSVIGTLILPLVLGLVLLLVAVAVRFDGPAPFRIAALTGLAGVLVAGAVGQRMAAVGERVFEETGHVPYEVVFGPAGSAKLAHAVGLHGLQLLLLLAVLTEAGRLGARAAATVTATAAVGYTAVYTAITVTAWTGRAPHRPTAAMAALLAAGVLLLAGAGWVAVSRWWPGRGTGSIRAPRQVASYGPAGRPLASRTGGLPGRRLDPPPAPAEDHEA
ncbi:MULTISPECIES: hypothetical protein [unclassified Streptomyces]|uniref:hypothetical protein n=1 Tax=unclassified Streptomyces TaxID=2593676 RepID=UPI003814B4F5